MHVLGSTSTGKNWTTGYQATRAVASSISCAGADLPPATTGNPDRLRLTFNSDGSGHESGAGVFTVGGD
jgi:hypothetical protein